MSDIGNALYYIGCGLAGLVVVAGASVLFFFVGAVSSTGTKDIVAIIAVTAIVASLIYLIGRAFRFALNPDR
jgi:membrane protein DedA with SNARE-associated domain